MKLLILTCLVATALARHKFHLGHLKLTQEQPESSEQEILKERKLLRFVQTVPLELREEYVNELNRRELLREKENEEIKGTRNEVTEEHVLADRETEASISSSSEEIVPSSTKQKYVPREDLAYQPYVQQQLLRMKERYQIQEREPMRVVNQELAQLYLQPFEQPYQLDAYLPAPWYYTPEVMQYVLSPLFYDLVTPSAFESAEKTVIPEWLKN
ncbi:alpha-S1-casein isoform X3 [Oryctolagus cuniculus]|uniref:alpha-S1-casein isoform X3 n=1 Tax=Oryctolagus cuniculus TaxID=9986 RepID=UPI00222E7BAA|nr:alpha-S1-casein isoform X3 [Oryctolagus cuniculus]